MIEVVFHDSACGGLKIAQHYGIGEYGGGGTFVLFIAVDDRQPSKQEEEEAE